MIRLNENGKTFVSVGSWEEIYERPGFMKMVDSKEVKLKEIIGQYVLHPQQPCGLKGCRSPHNKGYIVVIDGGLETIIGNVCGKNHFGVSFSESKSIYDREVNAQRFRENIFSKQARIPNIRKRVLSLREGESRAEDCYQKMHAYITRLFDGRTANALEKMAKAGNGSVTRDVMLTRSEREMAVGRLSQNFRTETLFIINGIRSVVAYKKLSPIAFNSISNEIDEFEGLDANSLDFKSLRAHNNWANRIEKRLDNLQNILEDCIRFLVPSNIANINARKSDIQRNVVKK